MLFGWGARKVAMTKNLTSPDQPPWHSVVRHRGALSTLGGWAGSLSRGTIPTLDRGVPSCWADDFPPLDAHHTPLG